MFSEEFVDIDVYLIIGEYRRFSDGYVMWIVLAGFIEDDIEVLLAGEPHRIIQLWIALHSVFKPEPARALRERADHAGPNGPPRPCDDQHLASLHARLSRSEEHTSELQSLRHLVCRLLLEKKK